MDSSSNISFSLSAMPIQSFIKSRKPDLQLEITAHDQNKFQRELLLIKKSKYVRNPCQHHPFLTASSLPAWPPAAARLSAGTSNSNLVTQERFDLPIQSHYSAGQIHWPTAPHNTLLVITCKYLPSLLSDIHNTNKRRENERTDAGKGTGAFKNQDEWMLPSFQKNTKIQRKKVWGRE